MGRRTGSAVGAKPRWGAAGGDRPGDGLQPAGTRRHKARVAPTEPGPPPGYGACSAPASETRYPGEARIPARWCQPRSPPFHSPVERVAVADIHTRLQDAVPTLNFQSVLAMRARPHAAAQEGVHQRLQGGTFAGCALLEF